MTPSDLFFFSYTFFAFLLNQKNTEKDIACAISRTVPPSKAVGDPLAVFDWNPPASLVSYIRRKKKGFKKGEDFLSRLYVTYSEEKKENKERIACVWLGKLGRI